MEMEKNFTRQNWTGSSYLIRPSPLDQHLPTCRVTTYISCLSITMARRNYRNAVLAIVALLAYTAYAKLQVVSEKVVDPSMLSTQEIEEQLQVSLAYFDTLMDYPLTLLFLSSNAIFSNKLPPTMLSITQSQPHGCPRHLQSSSHSTPLHSMLSWAPSTSPGLPTSSLLSAQRTLTPRLSTSWWLLQ